MRLALFFAALLALTNPPAARADAIDRIVVSEMQRQRSPAVGVAVVKDGVVTKAQGYGFANLEHHVPASADTFFQTASIGKQFTAALVMLLVRDGRLRLDEPVAAYLPDAPPTWAAITVRHLLTHTAALDRMDPAIDLRKDYTEAELLASAYRVPLMGAPGAQHAYSNLGYQVLGIICSRVGGSFYGDQLRERLFKPLHMGARVISEHDIVPGRAAGYERLGGRFGNQAWVAPSQNTTADGSLYVTARDMARWGQALQGVQLLSQAEKETLWQPLRLNSGQTEDYGFGWKLFSEVGHRIVRHRGDWQGFTSHIFHMPEERLTITVLMNRANAQPHDIVDRIAAHYIKDLRRPPPKPLVAADLIARPIFIRGSMNDWKATLPLVAVAPGVFQAQVELARGVHDFKVADAEWETVDLGVAYDEDVTLPGRPQALELRGDNIVLRVQRPGAYTFELAMRGKAAPTLTVKPSAPASL